MSANDILQEIENIKKIIGEINCQSKPFLDIEEAASYICISKSTLYKLTSGGLITYYKPNGKTILFKREDLDEYVARGKVLAIPKKNDIDEYKYDSDKREKIINNLLK